MAVEVRDALRSEFEQESKCRSKALNEEHEQSMNAVVAEKVAIMGKAGSVNSELRRVCTEEQAMVRRAAEYCSAIKAEMTVAKDKAEHDLGEMRVEVHAGGNEAVKVKSEADRKLKGQAASFEDRGRVIASELREARGAAESAQHRCASQQARAEKWAADFANKFYAETTKLDRQARPLAPGIRGLEERPQRWRTSAGGTLARCRELQRAQGLRPWPAPWRK